ncbi:MAG: DUF4339 domain-containing protein, partial [Phycisphaerales bacterium]|nr:DUF4339 domain-containing protein [Phycisphaerales bacterium]
MQKIYQIILAIKDSVTFSPSSYNLKKMSIVFILILLAFPPIAHGSNLLGAKFDLAVTRGDAETVSRLINRGARVNQADDVIGYTPLHHAVTGGHRDVVNALLMAGANVNAKAMDGETPLYLAELRGYSEIAGLLRTYGASGRERVKGNTPDDMGKRRRVNEMLEILEQAELAKMEKEFLEERNKNISESELIFYAGIFFLFIFIIFFIIKSHQKNRLNEKNKPDLCRKTTVPVSAKNTKYHSGEINSPSEQIGNAAGTQENDNNEWFIIVSSQKYGPYNFDILKELVKEKKIKSKDLLWRKGLKGILKNTVFRGEGCDWT